MAHTASGLSPLATPRRVLARAEGSGTTRSFAGFITAHGGPPIPNTGIVSAPEHERDGDSTRLTPAAFPARFLWLSVHAPRAATP